MTGAAEDTRSYSAYPVPEVPDVGEIAKHPMSWINWESVIASHLDRVAFLLCKIYNVLARYYVCSWVQISK